MAFTYQNAPLYKITPGYCLNGIQYGYINIPVNGAGISTTLHTAITNLEAFITAHNGGIPYYYEMLGVGMPNSMAAPTFGFLSQCPQVINWAAPLVPQVRVSDSGSGNLNDLLNGTYNSKLDAIGNAFAAGRPNAGLNDIIRPGWEYNFSNYIWGIGVTDNASATSGTIHANTYSDIAKGMDIYMSRVRNAGYAGKFALNGAFDHTPVTNLMTRYDLVDVLDKDLYNNIFSGTYETNKATTPWLTIWNNDILPRLETLYATAVADNKLVGFSETGVQFVNNQFQADLNSGYWQLFNAWCNTRSDRVAFNCQWNQNISGEEDQMFFFGAPSGSVPTGSYPNYVNLGNQQNTSATGTITVNPYSKMNAVAQEYMQYMRAGTMQKGVPLAPQTPTFQIPTSTSTARIISSIVG